MISRISSCVARDSSGSIGLSFQHRSGFCLLFRPLETIFDILKTPPSVNTEPVQTDSDIFNKLANGGNKIPKNIENYGLNEFEKGGETGQKSRRSANYGIGKFTNFLNDQNKTAQDFCRRKNAEINPKGISICGIITWTFRSMVFELFKQKFHTLKSRLIHL